VRARAVAATAQCAEDGIIGDFVSIGVRSRVAIEADVVHDGIPEKTQPTGLPSRDREVAVDDVILKIAVLKSRAVDAPPPPLTVTFPPIAVW